MDKKTYKDFKIGQKVVCYSLDREFDRLAGVPDKEYWSEKLIKQTFPLVLSGSMDHMFTPDKIEEIIKIGFLLNNLMIDINKHPTELVFEYNDFRLVVVISMDELPFVDEDFYIHSMIKDEVFIKALKSFKRDNKLNEILV